VELISGTVGSTVKMPYVPNSMVMDRTGTNLYFGSSRELMIYATASNSLTKEDLNVPGVVLAAAPNNGTILINDQKRQLFYLYAPSAATYTTFSGVGNYAEWTPDSKTLYIVGYLTNSSGVQVPTLFVDNANTGWTTYTLSNQPTTSAGNLAITVPGVGAFVSGSSTVLNAWCPSVTASNTINQAYPYVGKVDVATDILAATNDGQHILGAERNSSSLATLYDIGVNISQSLNSGACPSSGTTSTNITTSPVTTPTPPQATIPIPTNVVLNALGQVVPSPASSLAFITYTAADGSTGTATLPYYEPAATGTLGTVGQVNFVEPSGTTTTPTAPIAGAFSLDDTLFFVSTSGDNLVHYINVKTLTDTKQISPGLLDPSGNTVPASFIAVKPRATT
jgi:hypothetical protein